VYWIACASGDFADSVALVSRSHARSSSRIGAERVLRTADPAAVGER
jgi:hypothetical protein